ncbi:hypothetical protein C8J56DRAFT_1090412 [Mycena floridula]|nr:hypothetical protein C8J56DRAFT_1090412 [Mycena floridula]
MVPSYSLLHNPLYSLIPLYSLPLRPSVVSGREPGIWNRRNESATSPSRGRRESRGKEKENRYGKRARGKKDRRDEHHEKASKQGKEKEYAIIRQRESHMSPVNVRDEDVQKRQEERQSMVDGDEGAVKWVTTDKRNGKWVKKQEGRKKKAAVHDATALMLPYVSFTALRRFSTVVPRQPRAETGGDAVETGFPSCNHSSCQKPEASEV